MLLIKIVMKRREYVSKTGCTKNKDKGYKENVCKEDIKEGCTESEKLENLGEIIQDQK